MPASASAMYALRPRSGTLWLANDNGTSVRGFSARDLSTPVVPSPIMLTIAAGAAGSVMVDGDGDLWVIGNDSAVEYDVNPDADDDTLTPKTTVTPLTGPVSGAFDADGSLWIVSATTVVMFSSAQLVDGGVVAGAEPEVTINAPSLASPAGVAFDADGNLWIVSADTVVMFSSAQLVDGMSVVPEVTIGANDGSLASPASVAFDADGNLWVSNDPGDPTVDTVVKFTRSQLAMSGNPAPDVTIGADADNSLNSPKGLAFDNSGDLWVASGASAADGGFLVRFKLSGAAVSSSPTAVIAMTGGFSSLAFSPSP